MKEDDENVATKVLYFFFKLKTTGKQADSIAPGYVRKQRESTTILKTPSIQ